MLEGGQQYLAYQLGASQFYLIAYALIFLLIMLVLPRGILPTQDRAAAAPGAAGSTRRTAGSRRTRCLLRGGRA